MMRITTSMMVWAVALPCWAGDPVAGSGVCATEIRGLAEFEEIEFQLSGDFKVEIGQPEPLKIEGDDNILPLIKTEVRDGRLIITTKEPFSAKNELDFTVTVADLTLVILSGCGDMTVRGLDNEDFRVSVDGSGDLDLSGRTGRLSVTVNGSGDLKLAGQAEQLAVSVNGSGDVTAFKLAARVAAVSIAGSGDVRVNAAESLAVNIAGSGDVSYVGTPKVVQRIVGSGDVHRRSKPLHGDRDQPEEPAAE